MDDVRRGECSQCFLILCFWDGTRVTYCEGSSNDRLAMGKNKGILAKEARLFAKGEGRLPKLLKATQQ